MPVRKFLQLLYYNFGEGEYYVCEISGCCLCRIDEIHMLVGGGSVRSGGLDISNLMKPALARGQLHCIGATTLNEHRKYFEKDAALERRFQPVMVEEPSGAEALVILEGLKVLVAHASAAHAFMQS